MARNPFPPEFLPIDAAAVKLLVLADWCEDHELYDLAKHLRSTARLWEQAGRCYWTPRENRSRPGNRGGVDYDIALAKLGYSH